MSISKHIKEHIALKTPSYATDANGKVVGLMGPNGLHPLAQSAHISFEDKPDGNPPSQIDSGQSASFIFPTTGRKPVVVDGLLGVEDQAGAGDDGLADYYQVQLSGNAHRVGIEWVQPSGADSGTGNMVYAAWGGIYAGGGSNVPASWVHIVVIPGTGTTGSAVFWVCNGTGNLIQVKSQSFVNPAADGATVWKCESVLDADNGMAYSILPDGTVMTVSNAEIATACTTASITAFTFADLADDCDVIVCEHYANTGASTSKFGLVKSLYGDIESAIPKTRQSQTFNALDSARQLAALRRNTPPVAVANAYAPGTLLTAATTTSAAAVDATGGRVTAVAGPSGKIIFHVAAYYEWSATDTLFMRLLVGAATTTSCLAE